ncbi:MAG TPA: acetate--CoA ligase family protein [Conexibacter sp.]|nr:acetate--CoA ligase family protein [Conexibacter sp.]
MSPALEGTGEASERRSPAALRALLAPRSIAVVGASASPAKAGHQLVAALAGFDGPVLPVNPTAERILGHRCYAAVGEIDEPVDLALLAVPAAVTPAALRDCAAAGVRAAVVCSGGFAEAGEAGAALQREVREIVEQTGIRVLGPNTSGFASPVAGVTAIFVPTARALRPGPLGIVAQSGGVNLTLAFMADAEGLGVSTAVGLGNAVDVGFADVVAYLAEDEATRAIALHVEGIADGRAVTEAIAAAVERKPVVALKVGGGGAGTAAFAQSHTGALAGDFDVAVAALRDAGAVVVDDLTALLDATHALAKTRARPAARAGVGVVTAQAGPGLLVADALQRIGVELPPLADATTARIAELLTPLTYQANPVDTGRPDRTLPDVVAAVASDARVDAVALYTLLEPAAVDLGAVLGELALGVPVLCATAGPPADVAALRAAVADAGVPVLASPERLAAATAAVVADARAQHMRAAPAPPTPAERMLDELSPALDEHAAKALLELHGIRAPRRWRCRDRDAARAALAALGRPAVVKALDARLAHKSDVGGVHVGVAEGAALERALDAIDAVRPRPLAYLVEELAPSGIELLVGGIRDPAFGPVVVLGLGGVTAEALAQTALALAPLSHQRAVALVEALPAQRLLDGFRGLPAVDRDELAAIARAIGDVLVAYPEIAEVEINPLRATAAGLFALDALVTIGGGAPQNEGHGPA